MKVLKLTETNEFKPGAMKRFFLVETSEFFKIINFNRDAGVTFPVHSHDLDGELSIQVLEGKGWFLGENDTKIPANTGDILVSEIKPKERTCQNTNGRVCAKPVRPEHPALWLDHLFFCKDKKIIFPASWLQCLRPHPQWV